MIKKPGLPHDNARMVSELDARLGLGESLRQAFLAADRASFLPPSSDSYADHPIAIGYGQTNSQPYTVAFMLKLLSVKTGMSILDVGCGSGWSTALLSVLAGSAAPLIATERIPAIADFGRQNLARWGLSPEVICPAGEQPGIPGRKFQRILVSAAAKSLPDVLLDQIDAPGIMVIPVKNSIVKIERDSREELSFYEYPGFSFVPLV